MPTVQLSPGVFQGSESPGPGVPIGTLWIDAGGTQRVYDGTSYVTRRSESGTVTGASNASTLNTESGVITTESASTAAGATFTETLTNSRILATSKVFVQVSTTGTGMPVVAKVTPAAGSVVIIIQNIHASAAFNAALVIYFLVVN